jgi:ABC-type glutathione transport system ATPase component
MRKMKGKENVRENRIQKNAQQDKGMQKNAQQENGAVLEVRHSRISDIGGNVLVHDFSLTVRAGETIGLVGESGSGKTLTLRNLIGLLPENLTETHEVLRRNADTAMIFQDPVRALDPLCPVVRQIGEVIRARQNTDRAGAREQALELIRRLDLPEEWMRRDPLPGELSGGQCQRVDIAIALACRPKVLLCDEPTTALDVTVQKQTLALIRDLQRSLSFAMVFVTHNLAVAAQVCERLVVLREGRIVESGTAAEIFAAPREEYTRQLIAAILPVPERIKDGQHSPV